VGSKCTKDEQCRSGLCLKTGVCSGRCRDRTDCPAGPQWSCQDLETAGRMCLCTATGQETCNGQDDDCDGEVDEWAICPGMQVCTGGRCACPAPTSLCSGQCVDLSSSPSHCGRCDRACPTAGAPPNTEAVCSKGLCGFGCRQGFGD
jgi:hypothetical protein